MWLERVTHKVGHVVHNADVPSPCQPLCPHHNHMQLALSRTLRHTARVCRQGASLDYRGLCLAPTTIPSLLEHHKLPPDTALPQDATVESISHRLRFLETLGVSNLAACASRDPELLSYDPKTLAAPRIEYLLSLGVTKIGVMISHVPQLLACDVTSGLHRKVAILRALGVERIAHYLEKNPQLLHLDVEHDMRPPIDFLRSVEGVDVGRVLEALPHGVFRKEAKLRQRVAYFEDTLGIPRKAVGRMITRWPHVLSYSLEHNLQPKVEWLQSVGVSSVGKFLYKHPRVLANSLSALEAKHTFLVDTWARDVGEIEAFPQALTYSLEYLRTRHAFLIAAGVAADKYKLHRTLRSADYLFATKLARRGVDEYQAFARKADVLLAEGGELSELGIPQMSLQEAVSAGAKAMARRQQQMDADAEIASRVQQLRRAVDAFFAAEEAANAPEESSPTPPTIGLRPRGGAAQLDMSLPAASTAHAVAAESAEAPQADR